MTNLPHYQADGFIKQLEKNPEQTPYTIFLLYGPEQGLNSERQKSIMRALVPDADPFRLSVLSQLAVKAERSKFFDEITAQSLMGGSRLLVVTDVDDDFYQLVMLDYIGMVEQQPELLQQNKLLLVASNLDKRSQLRKVLEIHQQALVLPAYQDDEKTLRQMLNQALLQSQLSMDEDTKTMVIKNLGSNRLITKNIIEQICLFGLEPYAKASNSRRLEWQQIKNFVTGQSDLIDKFISAILGKDAQSLLLLQDAMRLEKIEPIFLVRIMLNEMNRLQNIYDEVGRGIHLDTAIERMVAFFKHRPMIKKALQFFPENSLPTWRRGLLQLENQLKSSLPAQLLLERFFIRMARHG